VYLADARQESPLLRAKAQTAVKKLAVSLAMTRRLSGPSGATDTRPHLDVRNRMTKDDDKVASALPLRIAVKADALASPEEIFGAGADWCRSPDPCSECWQ
jgi:hypothetical protein